MRPLFFSILTVIISVGIFSSCNQQQQKPPETVNRLSWLNGNWQMNDKDGITTEQWQQVNDSLMIGKSDFIKGDSVIPFETIKFFRKDTAFFYEAKAAGQNNELPVAFKITSLNDSSFIAENPAHDFPKRISYRLVSKDSVHAFIDGGAAMPYKRTDFYYTRIKK
jgi:hypothetical protein